MKPIPTTSASSAKSLDCGKSHGRNCAYSGTYSVATTEEPSARNTSNTSTYATFAAMKLSMIVVITSLASVYAFSAPGIAPQKPPPTAPARTPATISATPATGPAGSSGAAASTVSAVARPPDDQLALCPDVEQPGAERDRDGEPGEDQQRRFRERQPEREVERRPGWVDEPRLTDRERVPERAVEQDEVHLDRVVTEADSGEGHRPRRGAALRDASGDEHDGETDNDREQDRGDAYQESFGDRPVDERRDDAAGDRRDIVRTGPVVRPGVGATHASTSSFSMSSSVFSRGYHLSRCPSPRRRCQRGPVRRCGPQPLDGVVVERLARHQQADFLFGHRGGVDDSSELSLVDHGEPVGEPLYFV